MARTQAERNRINQEAEETEFFRKQVNAIQERLDTMSTALFTRPELKELGQNIHYADHEPQACKKRLEWLQGLEAKVFARKRNFAPHLPEGLLVFE